MSTWLLVDDRPGNVTQSLGLLDALKISYQRKRLHLSIVPDSGNDCSTHFPELEAPWPELLITTGGRTVRAAEWVKKQSDGATRVVMLGRKGARRLLSFDAVVAPFYARLPRRDNLIETLLPLCRVNQAILRLAASEWPGLLSTAERPRVVALVGGHNGRFRWNTEIASRMAMELAQWVSSAGGTLTLIASRRTGEKERVALERGLKDRGKLIAWKPGGGVPYLSYLAAADVLVVTGDSESMLAEALATPSPVYLYRLPERSPTAKKRFKVVLRTTSYTYMRSRKWYAKWIHCGMVLPPPRDYSALYAKLEGLGQLQYFFPGSELVTTPRQPLNEAERVAQELQRLGIA